MGEAQSPEDATRYYSDLVRPMFAGRRFVLIGGAVVGLAGFAHQLRKLGSERPFLLGSISGTGELPKPEEAEWRSLDIRGDNVVDGMRNYEAALSDLPGDVRTALDRYDPDGSALVIGLILLGNIPEVAGRRRYAGSLPSWAALEDKVRADAFWDSIGVRRAPSTVVGAQHGALVAAAGELDEGTGTVWAGDAREGTNGGAVYVRWIRRPPDEAEASRFFGAHCDRVRVMPFLEGIPCSIHGVVFPDGVAVFRPVEMLTFRGTGSQLRYAGTSTFWDPPERDREEMRRVARRTGEALREGAEFRGPFTVDGVLSASGFLPTELNARFGAGLGILGRAIPDLPLTPVALAAQAGERLDFRPSLLEERIVEAADRRRGGLGFATLRQERSETESRPLVQEGDRYRVARSEETPDGVVSIGPGDMGGFVMFAPEPAHVPVGKTFAPRVLSAFAVADAEFDAGIGPLETAQDVRISATDDD